MYGKNKKLMKIMISRAIKGILIFVLVLFNLKGFSQEQRRDTAKMASTKADSYLHGYDSTNLSRQLLYNTNKKPPVISLTTEQSKKLLEKWYRAGKWNNADDPFRSALGQLIAASSYPSFDSAEYFLKQYPYDSLSISWDKFYIWEPVRIKIPYVIQPTDTSAYPVSDKIILTDSLKAPNLDFSRRNAGVLPVTGMKDTTILVIIDTLNSVSSKYQKFPFREFTHPYQGDSIKVAVQSLLDYVIAKDSSIINISGNSGAVTPIWLNSRADMMSRYWLKNDMDDSVTVWIGTPSRNNISLYLEKGVNFRKPARSNDVFDPKIELKPHDRSKLLAVQKIVLKRHDWKYRTESSFIFSQSALSNWVKGGENSVTLSSDITGYANYSHPTIKLSSNNFARLKFGFIASGGNPMRKNLDLLETNSKLNHKAFGKFDFSGILLFKTQIAPGKQYKKIGDRDTSWVVSKFFNPAILTLGFGLDYKPNKNTSLNFSPLSYKGTFVSDTANIDQTKYGVARDKKSKIEPGASFMINHTFSPFGKITLTNRLQLFTNYINNPQNIDVDWELIAVANLNWFTEIRFNTHLIFDDDTKTSVTEGGIPVKNPDGTDKKTARIQWKEMVGFSFIFKF